MDKKLSETTYLCVEIMNSKRQVYCKGETWSPGTNFVTWCLTSLIDLFSLYLLFSQYRSCDNTLENCFFQISSCSSPDRSRKQATFLSRVPVHCITPFCSDALVSPPYQFALPLSALLWSVGGRKIAKICLAGDGGNRSALWVMTQSPHTDHSSSGFTLESRTRNFFILM